MIEHPAILWTARLCVACYLLRYAVDIRGGGNRSKTSVKNICWTAGWVLLALHTAAAFHFAHDWSHAAAYNHTAKRTAEVVGLNWGGGIWFNEATLILWGIDVFLLWRTSNTPPELLPNWLRAWRLLFHAFLAMMFLSATVLFGPRYWWIVAISFACGLLALRFAIHNRAGHHDK